MSHTNKLMTSVSLSPSTYAYTKCIPSYVAHVTHQLECLPAQTRFLHAGTGLLGFFPHGGFIFSTSHVMALQFFAAWRFYCTASQPDSPIVGASDICQVSAYMHKLHEAPPGTSRGLLHFVQHKGSAKIIRY